MISWVVLSKTRVELTPDSLRVRLDRLYPGLFLPPQELRNFVVEGPVLDAQFLIQASVPGSAGLYMLQSIAANATGFSEFAGGVNDPALHELISSQQAWLSVDVIDAALDQDCRRFIGKILAELAPADSAILADPDRRTAIRFDEQVRGQLAREEVPRRLRKA
jgi:hypothetical protein